jgi:hypothetical protein
MPRAVTMLPCALLLSLGACSEPAEPDANEVCGDTVVSYTASNVDFAAIQTFALLPVEDYPDELPSDLPSDTQVSLEVANNAARAELIALGMSEVDPRSEEPDVYLFSLAASGTESGLAWQCVPGYVWWGVWGWVWDPCAWLDLVEVHYQVGTVIVGLADATNEEVVFGGTIQGVLACDSARQRLEDGIEKIFADYPS